MDVVQGFSPESWLTLWVRKEEWWPSTPILIGWLWPGRSMATPRTFSSLRDQLRPFLEKSNTTWYSPTTHRCRDWLTTFTNIARSLKPGWKFAASYMVKSGCDIESLFSFLRPARWRHITMNVMNLVHEDECEMIIKRHGIAMIHKSIHHCVHTFEKVKDFLIFVHTHGKVEEEDKRK